MRGTSEGSAMAKTVGTTAAVAAKLVLDGKRAKTTFCASCAQIISSFFRSFLFIMHCLRAVCTEHIVRTGVIRPVTPDVYNPILAALADEGIVAAEVRSDVPMVWPPAATAAAASSNASGKE